MLVNGLKNLNILSLISCQLCFFRVYSYNVKVARNLFEVIRILGFNIPLIFYVGKKNISDKCSVNFFLICWFRNRCCQRTTLQGNCKNVSMSLLQHCGAVFWRSFFGFDYKFPRCS